MEFITKKYLKIQISSNKSTISAVMNSRRAFYSRECIIALNETFRKAETLPQQAIREKYKAEK